MTWEALAGRLEPVGWVERSDTHPAPVERVGRSDTHQGVKAAQVAK